MVDHKPMREAERDHLERTTNTEKTSSIDPEERLAFLQKQGYDEGAISSWGWTDGEKRVEWIRRVCFAAVNNMNAGDPPPPLDRPVTFYSGSYSCDFKKELPWVQFILNPKSPWWPILDSLAFNDPERNLRLGYIFKDFRSLDARCFYSFLMATRFGAEHPGALKQWLALCEEGADPRDAWLFSQMFTSCNTPGWQFYNGGLHTFISYGAARYIGRFSTSNPMLGETMKEFFHCTPNQVIWELKENLPIDYRNPFSPSSIIPEGVNLYDPATRTFRRFTDKKECWDVYHQVKAYQLDKMGKK